MTLFGVPYRNSIQGCHAIGNNRAEQLDTAATTAAAGCAHRLRRNPDQRGRVRLAPDRCPAWSRTDTAIVNSNVGGNGCG